MKKILLALFLLFTGISCASAGDTTANGYFYLPALRASGSAERDLWYNSLVATDAVIKLNSNVRTGADCTSGDYVYGVSDSGELQCSTPAGTGGGSDINFDNFIEGSGIDFTESSGNLTIAFDPTQFGTKTWGNGVPFTWTMNAGSTDPSFTFDSGTTDLNDSTLVVHGTASQTTFANNVYINGDTSKKLKWGLTGGGNNENLFWDLDTTSNVVAASSTSGVTSINTGTIGLVNTATNNNFSGLTVNTHSVCESDGTHCPVGITGAGDITLVGDCTTGNAFNGSCGTKITSTTSEIADMATDGAFIYQRNNSGNVTFMGKDNSDPANTIYDTSGAGAITIGSADVTGVSIITDGGTIGLDGGIALESGKLIGLAADSSKGYIQLRDAGTDTFGFMLSNVGIGTTAPVNKLDVGGSMVVGATYMGTNVCAGSNTLCVQGKIGVANTAPSVALDVTGTVKASVDVKVGSNSVCQSDGTNCLSGVIPSGTAPTVDADGEIAQDTTANQLIFGATPKVIDTRRALPITIFTPTAGHFPIIKMPFNFTISSVKCIVDPDDSSENTIIAIKECNTTGTSCVNFDSNITCDNDGAADDGTISNPIIDANNWVDITVVSTSGTVGVLSATINGTVNRE